VSLSADILREAFDAAGLPRNAVKSSGAIDRGPLITWLLRSANLPTDLVDRNFSVNDFVAIKLGLRLAGLPENFVKPNGQPNVEAIVRWALKRIEVRSAVAPPIVYLPGAPPSRPTPAEAAAAAAFAFVKPHVLIDTVAGRVELAPAGKPGANEGATFFAEWKRRAAMAAVGAATVTATIGYGLFALGKSRGKRV